MQQVSQSSVAGHRIQKGSVYLPVPWLLKKKKKQTRENKFVCLFTYKLLVSSVSNRL